jgi:AcrR family transcriptional regulator
MRSHVSDTTPSPVLDDRPPRRRKPDETERAILDATREILAEGGVPHLTIEAVAARSGVAKTTIYRRWRAKDELALAVVIDMVERVIQTPDLGNTRDELIAFVDATVQVLGKTPMGRVLQGLVSDLATDPELALSFAEKVVGVRLTEVDRLIRNGIERGEIRPGTDPYNVNEILLGAVYYRLLFSADPLDDGLAERIVDYVLNGIGSTPPPG